MFERFKFTWQSIKDQVGGNFINKMYSEVEKCKTKQKVKRCSECPDNSFCKIKKFEDEQ